MKLVFLGTAFSIIYYMRFHKTVKTTYDREQDTFRVIFLIAPCLVLALFIHHEFTIMEVIPILGNIRNSAAPDALAMPSPLSGPVDFLHLLGVGCHFAAAGAAAAHQQH